MRIIFTPLLLILFFVSNAQDGQLDVFGWGPNTGYQVQYPTNGVNGTPLPVINEPQKIAILTGGDVLQCYTVTNGANGNDFGLIRYNADGSVDPGFGLNGYVVTDFGGDDHAITMAVTSGGKIIVAGRSDGQFAIARYNSNGTLDNTFDGDGKLVLTIGTGAQINAVVENGGVITVGGTTTSGGHPVFALARFTNTGALDASFNGTGTVTTSISGGSGIDDAINSIALQSDGKIVAAGYTTNTTNTQFAIARYNTTGTLDLGFDGDGVAITPVGSVDDGANAVAIQNSTGKIIAAGYSSNGSDFDFAVVRYAADGTLDAAFDGDGKLTMPIGSFDDVAFDVAFQSDGKILLAGATEVGSNINDFTITRLSSDGSIDAANFGESAGKTTIDFGGNTNDVGYDITLASSYIMFGGVSGSGLGTARLTNSVGGILPVHIISFIAAKRSASVALSWQAANERGVDSYDIERSADGVHFSKVGSVPGGVNNNYIKNYSFEDHHPASINFYRLRIVNANGKIEYTSTVVVKFDNARALEAFPNPVQSNLNLQITQPKGKISLQLFDVTGRLVEAYEMQSSGTTISTSIDVSNLKKGIYLVKANEEVIKLLKE